MRAATHDVGLVNMNGVLVGVCLGWDFAAEHEWGIAGIQRDFGLRTEKFGLDRYLISSIPPKMAWVGDGFQAGYWNNPQPNHPELRNFFVNGIAAAWDERSFGVRAKTKEGRDALREIWANFMDFNGAIWLGGNSNPFSNSGLILAIGSRVPEDVKTQMKEAHEKAAAVKKEFEETGIEKLLKDAGKRYYALSPRRSEDGTLRYWLNPMDQDKNKGGWFTIEDLRAWAKGGGPIPKGN